MHPGITHGFEGAVAVTSLKVDRAGRGGQHRRIEAKPRGVDYMIEKPFDQDDLREVLAEAMGPK